MNYVKTNHKWARQRGTTLIELSVVIAVILLLVGVLFIGIQAWRDGANKAACLVNISSIQKAVRGYQNMNPTETTVDITVAPFIGATGFFSALPKCPSTGADYTPANGNTFPAMGTAFVTCTTLAHNPTAAQTANW
jgi:prepilin-type N-terminal cleavage/methylation domain-containing protein